MEKVDITYAYEQKEYIMAVQQYLLASRTIQKRDFVIMPLLFIVLLAALFYTHFNQWVVLLATLAFIVVLLGSFLYYVKPWYDYSKTPLVRDEIQLSFTEEGIHMLKQGVESQLSWDLFEEAWENRGFFFLIQQPRIYSIIPKRAFASPEEQQFFVKLLYRKIGAVDSIGRYNSNRA